MRDPRRWTRVPSSRRDDALSTRGARTTAARACAALPPRFANTVALENALREGGLAMARQHNACAAARWRSWLATTIIISAPLAATMTLASAQTRATTGVTADAEFSQQLGELKKSFTDVGRTI